MNDLLYTARLFDIRTRHTDDRKEFDGRRVLFQFMVNSAYEAARQNGCRLLPVDTEPEECMTSHFRLSPDNQGDADAIEGICRFLSIRGFRPCCTTCGDDSEIDVYLDWEKKPDVKLQYDETKDGGEMVYCAVSVGHGKLMEAVEVYQRGKAGQVFKGDRWLADSNSNVFFCYTPALGLSVREIERHDISRSELMSKKKERPSDKHGTGKLEDFLDKWNVDSIVEYLDQRIVGQDKAKQAVAAVCFEHVYRLVHDDLKSPRGVSLLFGPTGSGKTELIRIIGEILPVPVVTIDASLLTSEGFRGRNITDAFKKHDTSNSIIIFDEFDKLCKPRHNSQDENVSEAVQGNLLKVMEGESDACSAKHATFLCAGAFDGAFDGCGQKGNARDNICRGVSDCLIDYGMMPEIAGRITTLIPLKSLDGESYKRIINMECGPLEKLKNDYKHLYNAEMDLTEDGREKVCHLAMVNNLGARGIESAIRNVFASYRREATGKSLMIDGDMVESAYLGNSCENPGLSREGERKTVLLKQGNSLTLADVAGLREEKESLRDIIDFMKDPGKYTRLGARFPKGVLLSGPSGTGKTMLAKAMAGEAGVPFYAMSGSDFLIGREGERKVREIFSKARRTAPAVLFIDEIDSIARARTSYSYSGILTQILVEMDGFSSDSGLIVIAATNLKGALDPAITRAGRFDRKIDMRLPDIAGREAILRIHARDKKISKDVDFRKIAKMTMGCSGADLETLLNEAAINAAKAGHQCITPEDITGAFVRTRFGVEKPGSHISPQSRVSTAYHEAGHAVVSTLLPLMGCPEIISIIPTADAMGYAYSPVSPDVDTGSKEYLLGSIKVLLAGRIAEEMHTGDISIGAANDLAKANTIAARMVTEFGMSRLFGPVIYKRECSEATARDIDSEIEGIIRGCYEDAMEILESNRSVLAGCVELLLQKERVSRDELASLLGKEDENVCKEKYVQD